MYVLYDAIRTGLPPLGESDATNQWVLASKICARKRPLLFPVRDSHVCRYLAANDKLGNKPGRLGAFTRDIQVWAYLSAHPAVRQRLAQVREEWRDKAIAWSLDSCDLRLLDSVLWTQVAMGERPTPS
jgi:Family of unknown function (DUF6308)